MTERNRPVPTQAANRQSVNWPALTRTSPVPGVAPSVRAGTSSGGQALDKKTQRDMSSRFGHDFSQVRIHTDARAGDSAEAMGANAYALGSDIVFGGGKYQPGSRETERLLAHELTHVVQQSTLGGGDWGRMSQKGDASEREADSLASQVMMGRSVQVQAAPGSAVARDEEPNASYMIGPPDPLACYSSGSAPSPTIVGAEGNADANTQIANPAPKDNSTPLHIAFPTCPVPGSTSPATKTDTSGGNPKDMPALRPLSDEEFDEGKENMKVSEENRQARRDLVEHPEEDVPHMEHDTEPTQPGTGIPGQVGVRPIQPPLPPEIIIP